MMSDSENETSDSEVEFSVKEVPVTAVERSRRTAKKAIKYDFSDADDDPSSENELEVFKNNDGLNTDSHKPAVIDMSSDSDIEKPPPKAHETSEDLFDALIGKIILFTF